MRTQALPQRDQEILSLRAHIQSKKDGILDLSTVLRDRVVDTSQSVNRSSISGQQLTNTLTPGGSFWLGTHKRMLLGREMLSLQGFPWPCFDKFDNHTEHLMADLAGNAMSGPCVMAAFLGLFVAVLRLSNSSIEEAELDELLSSLGRAM